MKTTIKTAINLLNRSTRIQRESFYNNSIAYQVNRLDTMIKAWEGRDLGSAHTNYRLESNYIHSVKTKESINIKTLSWLEDAREYFDGKIEQAAKRIEKLGFVQDHLTLDVVDAEVMGGDLSFYITAFNQKTNTYESRLHARLIWVDCYEKQSHYRFIITKKKI